MPAITTANIEAKMADLQKQHEQALAQLNAIAGAKQAYQLILDEINAPTGDEQKDE